MPPTESSAVVRRSGLRIAVLLTVLAIVIAVPRSVAPAERMRGAGTSCSSPQHAAVADRVAAAFDEHRLVFIGSTHGGGKRHEFLLCLLSRPGLQRRVTNVLVEWANPVHQRLMDRYLLVLEHLPRDSLHQVWFDTDAPQLWAGLPQVPAFFDAVREMNARLEPGRRIRVLGGSEPVNWSRVRTAGDLARYPFKTNWAAHIVTEHFAAGPEERLLVVYGDGHIHHNGGTLMSDLEAILGRAGLFVVGTIVDPDPGESETVAALGDPNCPFFRAARDFPSTGPYPKDLFYAADEPLASYVDAVVYLGPEPDRDLAGQIELTATQRAELARREALKGDRRRLMELRFGSRDLWFQRHPNDLPGRP